jgi:hypothetical protein
MPIESLQCPNCGSPLLVESTSPSCTCTYCRAELGLMRGSSGHLLGVPSDLPRADSSFVTRLAIEHLEQRVEALLRRKDSLEGERQKEAEAALSQYAFLRQVRNWVVVGSAVTAMVGSPFVPWLAASVLVAVVVLLAWPFVDTHRRRAEQEAQRLAALKYERTLAGIEHEIEHARAQIIRLRRGQYDPAPYR